MKRTTKRILTVALMMLFALNFFFSGTEWMFVEAFTPVNYLEDVKLFEGKSEKFCKANCEEAGYKFVPCDLNDGTSTDAKIYLGYKTTTNRDFAITSLAMLGMNSGYQLRDYREMAEVLKKRNTGTAETMANASSEMARLYAAGSPKAIDACECLNLYSVDKEGELKLGDFIVDGKADIEFYEEFILKASGGTVTSVLNFLNTGIAPVQAVYDEVKGVVAGTWADAASTSVMWDTILSDSDLVSTDEKSEMHRLYDDDARMIFSQIQNFATFYKNAASRNDDRNGNELFETDERYEGEDKRALNACADYMDDMKSEDADDLYLGAYDLLNEYELPSGEGLGEYIVDLGCKTSAEVDITELYPIVSSMSEGQAGIISTSGLLVAVYNISENISVFESDPALRESLEETKDKIEDLFGTAAVWAWTTSEEELYDSNIAITNDAVRRQAAEAALSKTASEEFEEDWMLIQKYISIISGAISLVSIVVGKLLVWAIPKIAAFFIGTKTALAAASTTIATITNVMSIISTCLFWAGIIVLVITIVFYIVQYFEKIEEETSSSNYTTMPEIVFDTTDVTGGSKVVRYNVVRYGSTSLDFETDLGAFDNSGQEFEEDGRPQHHHLSEEEEEAAYRIPDEQGMDYAEYVAMQSNEFYLKKGDPGDLNCYKSNKWTLMYYSKDRDAGSPICEDDTGTMFKVVNRDHNRQNGYEPLAYFSERSPGNTNAYSLRSDKLAGIYVSYRTEKTIKDQMAEPPVVIEPEYSDGVSDTDVSASDVPGSESYTADGDNSDAAEPEETQETVKSELPPDSGYIAEVIVETGKDALEAKAKIDKRDKKFYIVDHDLTPQQDFATYMAYSLTDNKEQAVRDIRVASYVHEGDIKFGDISYGCSGPIGVKTSKDNSTTEKQCDGLFYTTDKRAGTPLRPDSLHIVEKFSDAKEGWEPVTLFCGLPYDFNTCLGEAKDESQYRTQYKRARDKKFSSHRQMYVYYEPETMYVGGEKYLSGMFFAGGTDIEYYSREDIRLSEILDFADSVPNSVRIGVNLQESVKSKTDPDFGKPGSKWDKEEYGETERVPDWVENPTKKEYCEYQLYLYYTWSYNPYRALYDLTLYEDVLPSNVLPYNLRKARSYESVTQSVSNASKSASEYDNYVSVSTLYQYVLPWMMFGTAEQERTVVAYYEVARNIVDRNAFMNPEANTTVLEEPFHDNIPHVEDVDRLMDVSYKTSVIPTMGLYVEGCATGKNPLRLSDVVISSELYEAANKNGEIFTMLPAEDTLAGTKAEGSFRPVCDCKNPNSLLPVDLSYPDITFRHNDRRGSYTFAKQSPVYIYVKGTRIKGKYISRVFVGTMSGQQYRDSVSKWDDDNENEIFKQISRITESAAVQNANSEASDEVIFGDFSRYQSDCWYNLVDANGYNDGNQYKWGMDIIWKQKIIDHTFDDDAIGSLTYHKGVSYPASYIGVARTDNKDEAITGVLLFKDDGKSARSVIQVSGASYYCASSECPIYINAEKYYLYYTFNLGVSPGRYVTDITVDSDPMISKCATVLVANERDPDVSVDYSDSAAVNEMIANYAKPYGDPNMPSFIHLGFDAQRGTYYNNLYIGRGVTKKAALCDLLAQGCVEFCDIDLNKEAGGDYVYMGYRSFSIDYAEINALSSALAKKKELNKKMNEAIYDIVCTEGEPYQPDGFVGTNGAYYYPVSDKDLNSGTTGKPIYMYYCSTFRTTQYNNKKPAVKASEATKVFGSDPITQIAFARYDRVPYYGAEGMASPDEPLTPWEYVLRSDNKRVDLNHGAIKMRHEGNSYRIRDVRISMFVQREKGSVKPAGEITGGFYTDTTTSGNLYYKRG